MMSLKRKTKTYKNLSGGEVVQALEQIGSKRLQPFLPEAIGILEHCQATSCPKTPIIVS